MATGFQGPMRQRDYRPALLTVAIMAATVFVAILAICVAAWG